VGEIIGLTSVRRREKERTKVGSNAAFRFSFY